MFHNIITFVMLSHHYLPYCSVHTSLYLESHYYYVVTSHFLHLLTLNLMLCFSSVPLFRRTLYLRRCACVSHCTIVCLHITLCTICMSLYLVPRCDVLAALLYSTSLNHVLYWSCFIISGTELLLGRHIWLHSSHVIKHRFYSSYFCYLVFYCFYVTVGCVVLFSPLHIPYSTIHNKTS
jgi:hypothetical protein